MIKLLLFWTACLLPTWGFAQVSPSDSLTQSTGPAQPSAITYRYVNATSLTLRSLPDALAAAITTIEGASRVQLVREREDGWSQVQVLTAVGYVKSEYLVKEQEHVTAEVDWATVEAAGGVAYSSLSVPTSATHRTSTTHRIAPKAAVGPKVYICGNGRTEVYHNSESCAAMRRCTYQTLVMSQQAAQASGLRGCMKCN